MNNSHAEQDGKPRRRCLLFVVDALAEAYVRTAIEDARLPHLAELLRQGGQLVPCTSIFPSITPAATCTLATGAYPAQHGIEGAYWLDQATGEMAYFGDDFQLLRERGLHQYLIDFGDRLNEDRLHAPTVFERVEAEGRTAGCINFMWFHGNHRHKRSTPWSLRAIAGRLSGVARGPSVLLLGDFVLSWPEAMRRPFWNRWGAWHRYGFDDATTMARMMAIAEQDCLPDFTLAYFPNNDYDSHVVGPRRALETAIAPFDDFLGRFVQTLGGWEAFGEQYSLLVVGDHAQSPTDDDVERREVRLDQLLDPFGVAKLPGKWEDGDSLCICPNMRAAGIYLRQEDPALGARVVDRLLEEPRVDQVIWQERDPSGDPVRYRVRTANRGQLQFSLHTDESPGGEGVEYATDERGNRWAIKGDWRALDMRRDDRGQLVHGNYPNALERIANSFAPTSSPIWVTARLGCEFRVHETTSHGGGSHGGLNWEDSDAGLVAFGLDQRLPSRVASVDVLPLCLRALGISARNVPGTESPVATATSE